MKATSEKTTKPWFGPRKRAREVLSGLANRPEPVGSLDEFLATIDQLRHGLSGSVQHVRFVDFVHDQDAFHYTIAICFTRSVPAIRDWLYEHAGDVAASTGWYPLVQGERLGSARARRQLDVSHSNRSPLPELSGRLQYLEDVGGPDEGCAVRLRLSSGHSILLDTGFAGHHLREPDDELVLLTHTHQDHAGGWISDDVGQLPTIMSPATAQLLQSSGRLHSRRRSVHTLPPDDSLRCGSIRIQSFLVPHSPGSVGYVVSSDDQALIYTGDVTLRSDRHDFVGDLVGMVGSRSETYRYTLLDATMVSRSKGTSLSAAATELLEEAQFCRNVVVTARDPAQLLYALLDLFRAVQGDDKRRHSAHFLVTPDLRNTFQVVHHAFITRDFESLDPFLLAQYGASMSSWAESRWLWWLGRSDPPDDGRMRLWFLTHREAEALQLEDQPLVAHIGRGDPPAIEGARRSRADTAPWSLHTGDAVLVEAVERLEAESSVLLFHSPAERIDRWLRDHRLDGVATADALIEIA